MLGLTVLVAFLGWLGRRMVERIDELEKVANQHEVAIEVGRSENRGIRADIAELKVLLRDIARKLDEHREREGK